MVLIDKVEKQCKTCVHRNHESMFLQCMKYGGMLPPIFSEGLFVRKCDTFERR